MILPFAALTVLASVVSAIPFKRYDNETISATTAFSLPDTTITVDKYITTTLSGSSVSARSLSDLAANTQNIISVVTEYVTISTKGSAVVTPVTTFTTTMPESTTTSTLTSYVTITESDGTVSTEAIESGLIETAEACVCVPSTVTVTATNSVNDVEDQYSAITLISVTAIPVYADFTFSGLTTTITSYVEVTLTETTYSPIVFYSTTTGTSSTPDISSSMPTVTSSSAVTLSLTYSSPSMAPVYSSFNNQTVVSSGKSRRAFLYHV
ncbi:hypothetical protein METBIDRAFT_148615 [Metschnikowia bicuspidata var. bicuspidata NRRL YB-4993]|uniref:Uncharacterized protein n=1 Tax=Metschnikowia bicuspidata var. bicuspidata NRRL YB-4993 TaxID=869754 RepID=A0A1A0HE09_9ASCO|nr:hypothetical protein METBIDRAFT_148615 [Metschnikowia bicuspidata var. bicuspidata NRRL YB-4993]OBA22215.1 hypothetical protein METBIDRAFT_148615 [Metschnikowia bicuspidata var. bicuspidata NRRL YB-4993]